MPPPRRPRTCTPETPRRERRLSRRSPPRPRARVQQGRPVPRLRGRSHLEVTIWDLSAIQAEVAGRPRRPPPSRTRPGTSTWPARGGRGESSLTLARLRPGRRGDAAMQECAGCVDVQPNGLSGFPGSRVALLAAPRRRMLASAGGRRGARSGHGRAPSASTLSTLPTDVAQSAVNDARFSPAAPVLAARARGRPRRVDGRRRGLDGLEPTPNGFRRRPGAGATSVAWRGATGTCWRWARATGASYGSTPGCSATRPAGRRRRRVRPVHHRRARRDRRRDRRAVAARAADARRRPRRRRRRTRRRS